MSRNLLQDLLKMLNMAKQMGDTKTADAIRTEIKKIRGNA